MRRWKELLLLLAAISVLMRVSQPPAPPTEDAPRVIAEGCIELGASFADVDAGLRAQGWVSKDRNFYRWHDRYWSLYWDADRLTGAVGRPGRLFFPARRLLLTHFDRGAVRARAG
jgi:hypothetical protein